LILYRDIGKIDYWKNGGLYYDKFTANRLDHRHGTLFEGLKFLSGIWKKGNCSACKKEGMYFDGEKKEDHFCIKCNPRIEKKIETLGMDSSYG